MPSILHYTPPYVCFMLLVLLHTFQVSTLPDFEQSYHLKYKQQVQTSLHMSKHHRLVQKHQKKVLKMCVENVLHGQCFVPWWLNVALSLSIYKLIILYYFSMSDKAVNKLFGIGLMYHYIVFQCIILIHHWIYLSGVGLDLERQSFLLHLPFPDSHFLPFSYNSEITKQYNVFYSRT